VPNADDMDAPVTKRELHEALEVWAGAIRAEMASLHSELRSELRSEVRSELGELRTEMATLRRDLAADVVSHIKAANEEMRAWMTAFDDRYRDLPPRVTRLESKVFAPKRRRR
jgi:hypothetical protein